MAPRSNAAMNRLGSTPRAMSSSNQRLARNGALSSRSNLNNSQALSRASTPNNVGRTNNPLNGNLTLNNGAVGGGGLGSPGIRTFGSNFFGAGIYGNSANGYGNGGYGYGNGGGGYGYRNSRYVMAYIPGVGWVLVPIRAIRRF